MGGYVTIAIRLPKAKKFTSFLTHTGSLLPFILNMKFIDSNIFHIKNFIEERKLLYDKKRSTFPFAPEGYGIVVADFVNKKIYSSQNYCGFEGFHQLSFRVYNDKAMAEEMFKKDLLLVIDPKSKQYIPIANEFDTFDKVVEHVLTMDDSVFGWQDVLQIDWESAGWKLNDYEDTEGMKVLYKQLKKNGIVFSEKEDKIWKGFIKSRS